MDAHPTIVFVDLTGSSAAYEAFDNAVVAGMVSKITRWVARVGKAHGGQTIKFLGDGVLLQFPAGILAVSAAVYLQQHYAEPLGQVPEGMRLGLKIGLASGSIVELHSDSYGDPVNLAARLCDMAGPHDIWADESVFDAELQGQAIPSARATGRMVAPERTARSSARAKNAGVQPKRVGRSSTSCVEKISQPPCSSMPAIARSTGAKSSWHCSRKNEFR